MIITIDGPVATGKSTIAKRLARQLGFMYFDTGAMYRCFTYFTLTNDQTMEHLLESFAFRVEMVDGVKRYYVLEQDVTQEIRSPFVSEHVSQVAMHPKVRQRLVELQKEYGKTCDTVFEGRDLGSVVFPHAEHKVFLTGDAHVRAQRRFKELSAKYPDLTFEEVLHNLEERDHQDSTRVHSPLVIPEAALVIDTSELTEDEVVEKILEKVHRDVA